MNPRYYRFSVLFTIVSLYILLWINKMIQIPEFNPVPIWLYYSHIIVKVIAGIFVIAMPFLSFTYWDTGKRYITFLSLLVVFLVGLQMWLGFISVDWHEGMINLQLFLDLLIIISLIFTFSKADEDPEEWGVVSYVFFKIINVSALCLLIGVVQIVLGTQVRQAIHEIATKMGEALRVQWVSELGISFYLHYSFAVLILVLHIYLITLLMKSYSVRAKNVGIRLLAVVVFSILTGLVVAYFELPALVQSLHLLFGTMMIGFQFLILINVKSKGRG